MGGQACVFYGAAEFSRDLDLLIRVTFAVPRTRPRRLWSSGSASCAPRTIGGGRSEEIRSGSSAHLSSPTASRRARSRDNQPAPCLFPGADRVARAEQ